MFAAYQTSQRRAVIAIRNCLRPHVLSC